MGALSLRVKARAPRRRFQNAIKEKQKAVTRISFRPRDVFHDLTTGRSPPQIGRPRHTRIVNITVLIQRNPVRLFLSSFSSSSSLPTLIERKLFPVWRTWFVNVLKFEPLTLPRSKQPNVTTVPPPLLIHTHTYTRCAPRGSREKLLLLPLLLFSINGQKPRVRLLSRWYMRSSLLSGRVV